MKEIVSTATSKVDEILVILRTEILSGQYRSGERLPSERDLSARFESNRGAIREVIKKLEQLGLIEVNPGGVRVLPIEAATLEIVPHLMDLGTIDQRQLIAQVLDVLGTLMALSVNSALALSTQAQREDIALAVDSLISSIDKNDEKQHRESFELLGEKMLDIHGNLILRLIGNGIRTQFIAHIRHENLNPNIDLNPIKGSLAELRKAILVNNRIDASFAIAQHFKLMKDAILTSPIDKPNLTGDRKNA